MESIVILDDDEEEPSSSSSRPDGPWQLANPPVSQGVTPTHITQSPFASAKKEGHDLQAENEKLFAEFVAHCSARTQDCPEVMRFLHAKHSKASADFLSSVEFRNMLGRCLTRAQANTAKTFVYINELCTVLKQHGAKKRPPLRTLTSASVEKQVKSEGVREGAPEGRSEAQEAPSTSGQQGKEEEEEEEEEEEKAKTKKASRRQVAYLENLLKVYNEEIKRLQESELSFEELEMGDSSYIQEHKLKRKMMKIYDKLCELKGCSTLTGRVIEQRIRYTGTRYPEINRKIERFINSPEVQLKPPDYTDILQLVRRTNERHSLALSRKQLTQLAQDAFRETGNRLQERRLLDMVYNFGSHLTDPFKPTADPALSDHALARRLRSNREVALSSLDAVITKYANKQDDTEEEERRKRLEKKAAQNAQQSPGNMEDEQKEEKSEEEEEQEEDEDDGVSSDPDIEEEIQASQAQVGPDDEEVDDDHTEPLNISDNEEQENEETPSIKSSTQDDDDEDEEEEEEEAEAEAEEEEEDEQSLRIVPETLPVDKPAASNSSSSRSPSQSEAVNSMSCNNLNTPSVSDSKVTEIINDGTLQESELPLSTKQDSLSASCNTRSANCSPLQPSSPVVICMRSARKRKREVESTCKTTHNGNSKHDSGSDSDIPLDMGVASSPLQADSTRADTPLQEVVTSSQSTPPPKKNKVNVATQCDPEEVIVLSDSD